MQSFQSTNGSFPLNAYNFFPRTEEAALMFPPIPDSLSLLSETTQLIDSFSFSMTNYTAQPATVAQMQSFQFPSPLDAYNFPRTEDAAFMFPPIPDSISLLSETNQLIDSFPMTNYTAQPATVTQSQSPANSGLQRQRSVTPAARTTRRRGGKRLREEARVKLLQNDEFVHSFGESWVTCAGCGKRIQLDSRSGARYYPRAFLKHKELCKAKKEGKVTGKTRQSRGGREKSQ